MTLVTYDRDSNPILLTTKDRFHDEAGTGALGDAATGPKARVSYAARYYDAADRLVARIDVGTYGGSAYSRPTSVPARSDIVLVTSYHHDDAGRVDLTTDPRGIVGRTDYDMLGRAVRTIDGYDPAINSGQPTSANNQTTAYTYDGAGHTLTVTAVMPAGTPSQTTRYPMFRVTPGTAYRTRTYGEWLFGMQPHATLRLRSCSDNI